MKWSSAHISFPPTKWRRGSIGWLAVDSMTSFMEFLGHRMYGGVSVMQSFNLIEIATPTNTRRVRGNPKHITSEGDYEAYIDRYNGRSQVYISLNPVNPNSSRFPTDKDITVWCNELLDLDLEKPIEIDEDVPDNYPKKCKHYAAREADLEKLKPYIERINEWLVSRGLKTGYQDHTGNGYRFILPVPGVVLEGMDLEAFAAQKREFKEQIARDCGIVDGCGVHLDSVFDPRRITGVPDTLNFKLETETRKCRVREPFRGVERDEDEALRDYILSIKIPEAKREPATGIKLSLSNVMNADDKEGNGKLRKLVSGDISGYTSRSEAELALACKLVFYNFSEHDIGDILINRAFIGKAAEKHESGHDGYITNTVKKAFEIIKERYEQIEGGAAKLIMSPSQIIPLVERVEEYKGEEGTIFVYINGCKNEFTRKEIHKVDKWKDVLFNCGYASVLNLHSNKDRMGFAKLLLHIINISEVKRVDTTTTRDSIATLFMEEAYKLIEAGTQDRFLNSDNARFTTERKGTGNVTYVKTKTVENIKNRIGLKNHTLPKISNILSDYLKTNAVSIDKHCTNTRVWVFKPFKTGDNVEVSK